MSEETTNEGATATQATPASAPTDAIETAPCYCCGSRRGVPTGRWWVLPALSSHVRCVDCGRTYNARSGESNAGTFLLHFLMLLLGVALGVGYYLVFARG